MLYERGLVVPALFCVEILACFQTCAFNASKRTRDGTGACRTSFSLGEVNTFQFDPTSLGLSAIPCVRTGPGMARCSHFYVFARGEGGVERPVVMEGLCISQSLRKVVYAPKVPYPP